MNGPESASPPAGRGEPTPLHAELGLRRIDIFGSPVDCVGLAEASAIMVAAAGGSAPRTIITSNVDFVMRSRADQRFRQAMWQADMVVADGVPLLWAARALGTPLKGRVNGTDLLERCAAVAAGEGIRIGLLGGTGSAGERAAQALRQSNPGLDIVAVRAPEPIPGGPDADGAARVRDAGAALLFVGLGSPKQDAWLAANLPTSGACVGVGIGSSIDIIAGIRKRAPRWMQKCGLEWLWRLLQEPGRLARRYIVTNSPFLLLVVGAAVRRALRRLLVARRLPTGR